MQKANFGRAVTLLVVVLVATAGNCTDSMIEPLAMNYRAEHDYSSLAGLEVYLRPGSHSRSYIEGVMGKGAPTETEGAVFYPSHEVETAADGTPRTKGLLLDYRDEAGEVTGTLQAKALIARPGEPADYWPAE